MELLLAMGVVVIGICSIMALFPISSTNSSNAAMKSYTSNVGYEFLYWAKDRLLNGANENGWGSGVIMVGNLPTAKPSASFLNSLDKTKWGSWSDSDTKSFFGDGVLLKNNDSSGDDGGYTFLLSYKSEIDSSEVTDFQGIITLWKDYVTDNAVDGSTINDVQVGVRLMAEVSWPASAPYNDRNKQVFALDVFNLKYDFEP